MSSTTATAPETVLSVPVDKVFVSSLNTRQPTAKSVAELVESIRNADQITPGIARPHPSKPGCYELAAGARRRMACEVLKRPLQIVIREMTDGELEDVILIENLQREDPDPMAEARLIQRRLDEKLEPSEIAARYGKTAVWVQRRMKLLALIPEATKAVAGSGKLAHFNTEMLEYVGSLPAAMQKEVLGSYIPGNSRSLSSLRENVGRHTCSLKGAAWLNLPETFVEGCGPGCATDSNAGLFPSEDSKSCGSCLNSACFRKRETLAIDHLTKQALGETSLANVVVFVREYGSTDRTYQGKKLKVLEKWDFEKRYEIAKKGAASEIVGLDLTKETAPRRVQLVAKAAPKGSSSAGSASGQNAPQESREDRLTGKRLAAINGKLREAVKVAPVQTISIVRIVAAFGQSEQEQICYNESTHKKAWAVMDQEVNNSVFIAMLWDRVKPILLGRLNFGPNKDLLPKWMQRDMERIAELIEFDYAAAWQTICTVEVPVPKSWGAGIDPVTLKSAKVEKTPAKKVAAKAAKKAPPKVAKKAAKKAAKAGGKGSKK